MFALVDDQLTWHVARASGLVAWVIATASIVWGLTLSTRLIRRRGIAPWLLDLHRYLGTVTVVFVVIHMIALGIDKYVNFGLKELFVPMGTTWRPGAVAWGIVAFYLLVAIQISSRYMRKLPRRLWHTIHLTSFVMFITGTVHGFQAGADANNVLVQWTCLAGCTLVAFLMLFRVLVPRRDQRAAAAVARQSRVVATQPTEEEMYVNAR